MLSFLLWVFISLYNFSYRAIGRLVILKNGGTHPKHDIINYKQFFLDHIFKEDTVLDIGCGDGELAFELSKKAARVTGIDISSKYLKTAKDRFSNDNLTYIKGDATVHSFKQSYSVIVLSNVLEHIEERTVFLKEIQTIAPKILIRVPLLSRDWLAVYKKKEGYEYRLDLTHYIEYTDETFEREMEQAGLQIGSQHTMFGERYAVVSPKEK